MRHLKKKKKLIRRVPIRRRTLANIRSCDRGIKLGDFTQTGLLLYAYLFGVFDIERGQFTLVRTSKLCGVCNLPFCISVLYRILQDVIFDNAECGVGIVHTLSHNTAQF